MIESILIAINTTLSELNSTAFLSMTNNKFLFQNGAHCSDYQVMSILLVGAGPMASDYVEVLQHLNFI